MNVIDKAKQSFYKWHGNIKQVAALSITNSCKYKYEWMYYRGISPGWKINDITAPFLQKLPSVNTSKRTVCDTRLWVWRKRFIPF